MDNRQEIINVLDMKEHMVFRNRRKPVGQTRETEGDGGRVQPQRLLCPKQELKRGGVGMAATAQLQQQV